MNGIKYVLDTNIIIGMYGRAPAVIELLTQCHVTLNQCAYSSITRIELLGYPSVTQTEIQAITTLLSQMVQLSLTPRIEDQTITLKQEHRIKLPDAIILATATSHNLDLLTLDKKLLIKTH